MKIKMRWLLSTGLVLVVTVLFLSGCVGKKQVAQHNVQVPLEIWGIFDDSDVFREINSRFQDLDPYAGRIVYKKIVDRDIKKYEEILLDALAKGKGPDIIFFKSTWLPKHGDKIVPLPNSGQHLANFRNSFVDVAYDDFVYQGRIFAKPLYCDTLALYYNRHLLNQAGLTRPPATWAEVKQYTQLLTDIDQYGNIQQSAIALGRAKNPGGINRAGDIVMLMMMQNGVVMNEDNGQSLKPDFDSTRSNVGGSAEAALRFYTSFANASTPLYTWNARMPYSIDAFRFGKTAMMINYSYWYDRLRRSDPGLDFGVAPVPQLGKRNSDVNYPSYWGLAVVKNKPLPPGAPYTNVDRINEAWRYINFVTGGHKQFDATEYYLQATHKPAARRDLIEKQKNDPVLGVFARQALTAKSWKQVDNFAIDEIFTEMIDAVNRGVFTAAEAVKRAEAQIEALVLSGH